MKFTNRSERCTPLADSFDPQSLGKLSLISWLTSGHSALSNDTRNSLVKFWHLTLIRLLRMLTSTSPDGLLLEYQE